MSGFTERPKDQLQSDFDLLTLRARKYNVDWNMGLKEDPKQPANFVLSVMSTFAQRLARMRKPELKEADPEYPDFEVPKAVVAPVQCINHADLEASLNKVAKHLDRLDGRLRSLEQMTESFMRLQEEHVKDSNIVAYAEAQKGQFLDANMEYSRMEGERDALRTFVDKLLGFLKG